ncbi:MAG TPA: EAL domain-containing protein, partial [Myxococcota bacterium]|nr:EAL domain-containing protein [Myxococcota bacterium]
LRGRAADTGVVRQEAGKASAARAGAPVTGERADEPATLDRAAVEIADEFARVGAAGVLAVDTSSLAAIARRYGAAPHREVVERLAAFVRDKVAPQLVGADRLCLGELGRDEVLVVFLRDRHDATFFRETLPALARELGALLASQGARLAYPYAGDAPELPAGVAPVLFDPTLRPGTLLRRGRDLALEASALQARVAAATRRERFLSLLFSEEVRIVFEPIVRLENRQVLGFEALVRGMPGSEFSVPAQLFAAAAECEASFELDALCRRTALRAADRLPKGAKLFLNCLPSAIHDPSLQDTALRDLLARHRLRPSDVVFEISERESIENFAVFREVCDRYSAQGFQIALDDVGAGYSSLEAVTELAPDYLKVDMSFVRGIDGDPARQEILKALTQVAWRIDARIVAEGIETEAELRTLRGLAVSYGQGYLIGRASELGPVG